MAYALEDAQDHLWDFFCYDVRLKDDECDKRVEYAVKDGTVEKIARRFLEKYRCDVAENDQYYTIIYDMFPDKPEDNEDEDE